MSINREGAKAVMKIVDLVKAFADGAAIQFNTSAGVWTDTMQLDLSYPPGRYRLKPKEHVFKRYLMTWTGLDGKTHEKIIKGPRYLADRAVQRNLRYKAFHDTKLHEISVTLPMA